jgi:hypothetical protein
VHCELIVPGLFSSAVLEGAAPRHPALEVLLARGRRQSPESRTLEQWLQDAFEQPEAPIAAGALGAAARGADPGEAWWARADPVHLRLMRDRAIVMPGEAMEISQQEADELAAALNRHFGDAARFDTLDPRRWAVRLHDGKRFLKSPALEAAGREVAASGGSEAMLTEIQMLLHAHPVNEAREARGEPAVNSLWLWGGGRAPRDAHAPWRSLAADDPSALGLAQLAGLRRLGLPASAGAWLEQLPGEGRHLVILDALRVPAALEQRPEYEASLDALERQWFAPLLAALRAERIGMVTLRVPDAAPGASFETVRGDLRRFWRRPRAIAHYA